MDLKHWLCRLIGHRIRYSRPFFYCQRCGFHFHNPYSAPTTGPTDITDRADRIVGQMSDGVNPVAPSDFASGTHPRDVTDKSTRELGQITNGTAAVNPADFASGTHPRDVTDNLTRVLGQLTDGTVAVNPADFGSGEHPRNTTDRAGRILGQVTDGTYTVAPADFASGTHPRNMSEIGGIAQTGRNWSSDFAHLDADLSTRATETTLTTLTGKTPTATSYTATAAATEYSFDLPAGTRRFTLKARGGRIDIGFVTAERPIQIADGGSYWEDMLDLTSARTVYYSSPTAGAIAEVLYWT